MQVPSIKNTTPYYSGKARFIFGVCWMDKMFFTAVIHQEGDWYVADCPEAGTVSQGKTIEEAIDNLREATELYLEEFPMEKTGHPLITTFEIVHA